MFDCSHSFRSFIFALLAFGLGPILPQATAQNQVGAATYHSEVDDLLTLDRVALVSFADNLQGIFARPVESHLRETLKKMHRWDTRELNVAGVILSPEEYELSPEKMHNLIGSSEIDGALIGRITKGPSGVTMGLYLFGQKDGKLLAKATMKDERMFEVQDFKEQAEVLLAKILDQIPFQGRILSRDNQRVTLNIGRLDGVQTGQIVTAIQIISVKRHPKFHFIVSSEKEILGRVKIVKADDTLSFGVIIAEKEVGAIRRGTKLSGLDFVTYPEVEGFAPSESSELSGRSDQRITFGEQPKPWLPQKTASFGQVGARIGLSQFSESTSLIGLSPLESKTIGAPSIYLHGELWITQHLSAQATFRNGIISVDNPRSGSSPTTLNQALTQYEFLMGYNWRFGNPAWGPQLGALLGFLNHRLYSDSATPEAYTTREFSGFKAGVRGSVPVVGNDRWGAGASLFMVLMPRLSETPVTSGARSTNTINMFGVFGTYRWRENIRLEFGLDFEMYSSNFSGTGTRAESARSASHRLTNLTGGIFYLF